MKYVSCLLLESGMAFGKEDVTACTCSPCNKIFWAKDCHNVPFDAEKYLELRNYYVDMMKRGDIPEQCIGCSNLSERDWPDEPGVEIIALASETKCSCRCYYCFFDKEKEYWNKFKGYDVMPILESLKEKNLLRHTTFDIVGGECTEYPKEKLDTFINFAVDNGCWLHFFTSGINFSKSIAYAMNKSRANIVVSIDSGTKEMYERIKRVPCYEKVWENMAKYSQAGIQDSFCNKGYVILKYIIIPGVNDSLEEMTTFINKSKEVGCKWLRFSVEYNWWEENKNKPMPENLWQILDYTEECKQDFRVEYIENAIYLWRKRMREDKNFTGINPCNDLAGC